MVQVCESCTTRRSERARRSSTRSPSVGLPTQLNPSAQQDHPTDDGHKLSGAADSDGHKYLAQWIEETIANTLTQWVTPQSDALSANLLLSLKLYRSIN